MIVTGDEHGSVVVWDLTTSKRLNILGHYHPVCSVFMSPDNTFIVTAGGETVVKVWSASKCTIGIVPQRQEKFY